QRQQGISFSDPAILSIEDCGAFTDRGMDDRSPKTRSFGINFGGLLREIGVVAGIRALGGKSGEHRQALRSAERLDVLVKDLVSAGRFRVGLLRKFDVIRVAVGRRSVLFRQTGRESRSDVAAMTGVTGNG